MGALGNDEGALAMVMALSAAVALVLLGSIRPAGAEDAPVPGDGLLAESV